jgi:hypothetical protein
MVNPSKTIVSSILNEDAVTLSDTFNETLLKSLQNKLESVKMKIVSEVFDNGEFSVRQLKEQVAREKKSLRDMVLVGLSSNLVEDFSLKPKDKEELKRGRVRTVNKFRNMPSQHMDSYRDHQEYYKKNPTWAGKPSFMKSPAHFIGIKTEDFSLKPKTRQDYEARRVNKPIHYVPAKKMNANSLIGDKENMGMSRKSLRSWKPVKEDHSLKLANPRQRKLFTDFSSFKQHKIEKDADLKTANAIKQINKEKKDTYKRWMNNRWMRKEDFSLKPKSSHDIISRKVGNPKSMVSTHRKSLLKNFALGSKI